MSSRLKGDEGAPLSSAPTKGSKWAVAKKTKNAISGFGMSTIVRKARKEVGSRHTTHSPSLSLSHFCPVKIDRIFVVRSLQRGGPFPVEIGGIFACSTAHFDRAHSALPD